MKEKKLQSFLHGLKAAFKNASIYRDDHPLYLQSVESLHQSVSALHGFMMPIYVGFTPNSIFIEGTYLEDKPLYEELSGIFHYRKIRSFEIDEGVTVDELRKFVSRLSIPPKEIIRGGGPAQLLKDDLLYIKVEELDYSELLKGEGEEIKDIWIDLVDQAVREQDAEKLVELSKSFHKVIKVISPTEILEREGLIDSLSGFFNSLNHADETRFHECSKDFLRAMMAAKDSVEEVDYEKFHRITRAFKERNVATTLWEEILTNTNFDSLEFNILTRLIDKEKQDSVAFSLANVYKKNETLNANPEVHAKIEELLSASSSPMISDVYRGTLAQLLSDISFAGEMEFDHDKLLENYFYILVNRMSQESDHEASKELLGHALRMWDKLKERRDFKGLKILHEAMAEKESILGDEPVFQKTNTLLKEFIESSILRGEISLFFEYFINSYTGSMYDVNMYLDKMFTSGNITPYTMMAFFKFFKEYMFYFNLNIDEYANDPRIMQKIMGSMQLVSPSVSTVILKNIYQRCQRKEKIRVLRTMRELSLAEDKFLLPILKDKNPRLKSEALMILIQNEERKTELLKKFLLINSPFGIRNNRILEHIKIVAKNNILDAAVFLSNLTKRRYYWNRNVRKLSRKVLENWNVD